MSFNLKYKDRFEKAGMTVSGLSPDGKLVEAVEIKGHPFFYWNTVPSGVFISTASTSSLCFLGFIEAAMKKQSP